MRPGTSPRLEQFRQARRIHGGLVPMCAASLGVRLSRIPIPSRWLRERVYRTVYGRKYPALDERELDRPLGEFRSLNALFTRGVRPECRPIPPAVTQWLCPCDSTIQDLGRLEHETLLTAKGTPYTLDSLLPGLDVAPFRDGAFVIFFLSPADCHRVFAPAAGAIRSIQSVPGSRLLVHPPHQRREFPVFTLNERVIFRLATELGECALVMVAGWGVGHITYPFEVPLRVHRRRIVRHDFAEPRRIERGEWMATFELGSTVILLTAADARLVPSIARDQHVLYGQPALTRSATGTSP